MDPSPASGVAGALDGRRILVTRARTQAAVLAGLLRREGAEPVELATIHIQLLDDWLLVDAALRDLAGYDWVVFSSANAVGIWVARLHALGLDARAMANVRIAAIGSATATALRQADVRVDLLPSEAVAESLLAALRVNGVAGRKVLLPQATAARKLLARGLEAAGAAVTVVALYDTLPAPEDARAALSEIAIGRIDAVTFTSSSTVRNFARLVGTEDVAALLQSTKVATIGPITATTARALGIRVDAVATNHTMPGLVLALCELLDREPSAESSNHGRQVAQTIGEE